MSGAASSPKPPVGLRPCLTPDGQDNPKRLAGLGHPPAPLA
jgi:hypothetical protein